MRKKKWIRDLQRIQTWGCSFDPSKIVNFLPPCPPKQLTLHMKSHFNPWVPPTWVSSTLIWWPLTPTFSLTSLYLYLLCFSCFTLSWLLYCSPFSKKVFIPNHHDGKVVISLSHIPCMQLWTLMEVIPHLSKWK